MSSIASAIEEYIAEELEKRGDMTSSLSSEVVLRRKDLAERFGCVPSQINYVLRKKFSPERGFLIESQRGTAGFIRIIRICFANCDERAEHMEELVGNAISDQYARKLLVSLQERGLLSARERLIVEVALRSQEEQGRVIFDLPPYKRDALRAELLKKILVSLAME